jgi:ABC-type Fe3+-hydroxamate transport system substrate-binding protein
LVFIFLLIERVIGITMKKQRAFMLLMTLFLVVAMMGSGSQPTVEAGNRQQTKIRFRDLLGRQIVLAKPARKVFLGFYFESFLAINGRQSFNRVVAMSKGEWRDFFYSQWRAYSKGLPRLKRIIDTGSIYTGTFSMEKAIAARPDVAILAPFQYQTLGENVKKLEQLGIPVVVVDYNAQTVERHVASTLVIGKIMGNEARARKIADEYVAAVNDVKRRVAKTPGKPKRVYFELANKGASVYGNSYGGYMWGNLIALAGGKNIALGKVENYGPLSPEYILASDPEVIFFAGLNWAKKDKDCVLMGFDVRVADTHKKLKAYTKRHGWNKLSAINNNQVYSMDHAGLRSLYDFVYLQYIAKALHPDVFKDVDPIANHQKFYKKYLPVEAVGSFMTKLP